MSLSAVGLVITSEFFPIVRVIIASSTRCCVRCDRTGQVQREIQINRNDKSLGNVRQTSPCRLIGVKTTPSFRKRQIEVCQILAIIEARATGGQTEPLSNAGSILTLRVEGREADGRTRSVRPGRTTPCACPAVCLLLLYTLGC